MQQPIRVTALCLNAALLLFYNTSPARAGNVTVAEYGVGTQSCGSWTLGGSDPSAVVDWVLGFWTGENGGNDTNHLVGHTTDAYGIVGEVQKDCQANPSKSIAWAVSDTYYRMRAAGD